MAVENNDGSTKGFQVRPGIGEMPAWGGMYRRGDPSQVPPNRFHSLLNVKLKEADVVSRAGLAQVAGSLSPGGSGVVEDACITGMFETNDDAISLYFDNGVVHTGIPVGSTEVPKMYVTGFNEERTPPNLNFWSSDFSLTGQPLKKIPVFSYGDILNDPDMAAYRTVILFRGRLLALGQYSYLYDMVLSPGEDAARADLSLVLDPDITTNGEVVDMFVRRERIEISGQPAEDADVLYLTTISGKILRWDGVSLTLEHAMAGAEPTRITTVNGSMLFAAAGPTGGAAYQLVPGGVWVDLVWPATMTGAQECWGLTDFLGQCVIVGSFADPFGTVSSSNCAVAWDPQTPGTLTPIWAEETFQFLSSPFTLGGAFYAWASRGTDQFAIMKATDLTSGYEWDWGEPSSVVDFHPGFIIPWGSQILYWFTDFESPTWNYGLRLMNVASATYTDVYSWTNDGVDPEYTSIPVEAFIAP